MTTRLLSAEDIYDVYGLEAVLSADSNDGEDATQISMRLREIRDAYIAACKSRIRAEAKFLGIDLDVDTFSFSRVISEIKKNIGQVMEQNAQSMMRGGSFNLMGTILKAHQAGGADLTGIDLGKFGLKQAEKQKAKDVDPNWFMDTKGYGGRVWDDPRWAEIAKAYLDVESANNDRAIIQAIDRLNQLQHNSFHVLIDLQTGRMLNDYTNQTDDREARRRLQEVLNIKLTASSVHKFKGSMSAEVRKLLAKYGITE